MSNEIVPAEVAQLVPAMASRPEDIIERATHAANILAPIIKSKNLFKRIGEKDHVFAEAWAALLGLMGVDPIPAWSKRLDREKNIVYECRMELYKNGQLIGAGEALASSEEHAAWSRSEHGIKSMAQTRALGKAARLKFAWIMVMAGYAPTAAEEMPEQEKAPLPMPKERIGISDAQQRLLFVKAREALGSNFKELFKKHLVAKYKTEHTSSLSREMFDEVLAYLNDLIETTPPPDAA